MMPREDATMQIGNTTVNIRTTVVGAVGARRMSPSIYIIEAADPETPGGWRRVSNRGKARREAPRAVSQARRGVGH